MQNERRFTGRSRTLRTAIAAAMMLAAVGLAPKKVHGAAAAGHGAASRERGRAYLGIEFHDTTEEQIAAFHLTGPRGAEIAMVDHDGPAGEAGLQPHDIVLQIDGQNVDAAETLSRKIRESAPGKIVSLSILRLGHTMTLTAKLADSRAMQKAWSKQPPVSEAQANDEAMDNILVQRYGPAQPQKLPPHGTSFIGTMLRTSPYTGASLETMGPQLAGFFGVPPKTGLLVHDVEGNSPAAQAGLRAGDVVLRMDGKPVATTSDWTRHLRTIKGLAVLLTVLRDHHEITLTMQTVKTHSELVLPHGPASFHC